MDAPEPGLSSLIITLADTPSERATTLSTLARRADLTLGEPGGAWVPAVLNSTDPHGAFREIEATPGVQLVEVVFVELPAPAAAR